MAGLRSVALAVLGWPGTSGARSACGALFQVEPYMTQDACAGCVNDTDVTIGSQDSAGSSTSRT
jgi:hypothetical protein